MWEYIIINSEVKENIIFGYTYDDACKRYNVDQNEWALMHWSYID